MIRPTIEWQGEDWFFEYENERLVKLVDVSVVRSIEVMTQAELEELTEALQLREAEIVDCIALVDATMDVMDYNKSFEKKEHAGSW